MKEMMTKYIACICEGGAETAIMNMLLDQNKLIFSRDELLEGEILKTRKGKNFETRYLKKDFAGKIKVYRVLDSRRENFKISKAYQHKVEIVNVITAPEIEMLIICNEGKYQEFEKKKGMSPSEYCKSVLKILVICQLCNYYIYLYAGSFLNNINKTIYFLFS